MTMTVTRVDPIDQELVQLKIFEATFDRLVELETQINDWLKAHRQVRLERVQFNAVGVDRAVVLVWHHVSGRHSRGVGFGEAISARE
jgi:hypothetical protein